jgi:hypothetical protein
VALIPSPSLLALNKHDSVYGVGSEENVIDTLILLACTAVTKSIVVTVETENKIIREI